MVPSISCILCALAWTAHMSFNSKPVLEIRLPPSLLIVLGFWRVENIIAFVLFNFFFYPGIWPDIQTGIYVGAQYFFTLYTAQKRNHRFVY